MKKYYLYNEQEKAVIDNDKVLFTLEEVLDYLLREQAHWVYTQKAELIKPLRLRRISIEQLYEMSKFTTEEEIADLAWEFNYTLTEAEEE